MNDPKILLPMAQGCALTYPFVDGKTLVRELIFTYRCAADCDNCHLPIKNNRTMPVNISLETVEESVEYAKKNGYNNLQLYLIGGEALQAFEALKEFYGGVQSIKMQNPDIIINIFIETCGTNISDECKFWLLEKVANENARDLYLILRWNSLNNYTKDKILLEDNNKYSDFWRLMIALISLRLEKENFSTDNLTTLYNNVVYINSLSKLCAVNCYFDMRNVNLRRYNKLLNSFLLKGVNFSFFYRSINGCSCGASEDRNIETIDFNGCKYHCKYLSPAYQLGGVFSQNNEEFERPETCKKCVVASKCFPCAAAMVKTNDVQCEIQRNLK